MKRLPFFIGLMFSFTVFGQTALDYSVRLDRTASKAAARSPGSILKPISSYESSVASASPSSIVGPPPKRTSDRKKKLRGGKRSANASNPFDPSYESPKRSTNPFDDYVKSYRADFGTTPDSSTNGASISSTSWESPRSASSLGSKSPTMHSTITSALRGIGAQFMSSTRSTNETDEWSVDSFSTVSRNTMSQRYRTKWQRPSKKRAGHQPLPTHEDSATESERSTNPFSLNLPGL